jgi:hypothetical protein
MKIMQRFLLSMFSIVLSLEILFAQISDPPIIVPDIPHHIYLSTQFFHSSMTSNHYFYLKNIGGDGTVDFHFTANSYILDEQLFVKGHSRDTLICTYPVQYISNVWYPISVTFPGGAMYDTVYGSPRIQPPYGYYNYVPTGINSSRIVWWSDIATNVDNASTILPSEFILSQNYPNPFNPTTTVSFSLPYKSFVSIKIFDLIGRDVATIVLEELSAGSHSRQWNSEDLPSGVYFYRLQAGSFTETKKLVLLR